MLQPLKLEKLLNILNFYEGDGIESGIRNLLWQVTNLRQPEKETTIMANKNMRTVKIYGMSGYKYQATPTIMLKGKWLEELGFEIGDYITVSCEDGRLIITPDTERAALAKAEQEFMEREMASLNKRFQKEKERLHAQFVAEKNVEYGAVKEA